LRGNTESKKNFKDKGSASPNSKEHKSQDAAGDSTTELSTSKIVVPSDMVGCIIGPKGVIIEEIREKSGAKIHIVQKERNRNEREVLIKGEISQIAIALKLLQTHLEQEKIKIAAAKAAPEPVK
jgi:predicted PilT family ATPase